MDNIQDFLNTIAAGQDTKPSDVVVPSSTQNDTSQYLSHGQNTWNYEHRGNNSSSESNQWFPKLLSFDCHSTKNEPRNAVISAFLGSCTLFKLNRSGRLTGNNIHYPIHMGHLIDDPAGHLL